MSIQAAIKENCGFNSPHGAWVLCGVQNGRLFLMQTGVGIEVLRDTLPDDDCCYALLTLRLTLQGVPDQPRHIWIQWKGPAASGMKKVKFNQLYQEALDLLSPNHGQLEAIGKTEFNEAVISKKWDPSAGSHVIE